MESHRDDLRLALLNGLLLRPLPYHEPGELVRLQEWTRGMGMFRVSPEALGALEDGGARSLDAVAAFEATSFNLETADGTESVRGARVTPGLLPLLGVRPSLGHDLWRERFGGDPGVVGAAVRLDGEEVRVIGVMPEGFAFHEFGQAWAPVIRPEAEYRGEGSELEVLARLADGVETGAAARDVEGLGRR